jgi:arsenate reductase
MADGWPRRPKGDRIEPWSAGVAPRGLGPRAVHVMAKVGGDISGQRSRHVDELGGLEFDCVVTVCDNARDMCPVFPGRAKVVHYRRVRDEIRALVDTPPEALTRGSAKS